MHFPQTIQKIKTFVNIRNLIFCDLYTKYFYLLDSFCQKSEKYQIRAPMSTVSEGHLINGSNMLMFGSFQGSINSSLVTWRPRNRLQDRWIMAAFHRFLGVECHSDLRARSVLPEQLRLMFIDYELQRHERRHPKGQAFIGCNKKKIAFE